MDKRRGTSSFRSKMRNIAATSRFWSADKDPKIRRKKIKNKEMVKELVEIRDESTSE